MWKSYYCLQQPTTPHTPAPELECNSCRPNTVNTDTSAKRTHYICLSQFFFILPPWLSFLMHSCTYPFWRYEQLDWATAQSANILSFNQAKIMKHRQGNSTRCDLQLHLRGHGLIQAINWHAHTHILGTQHQLCVLFPLHNFHLHHSQCLRMQVKVCVCVCMFVLFVCGRVTHLVNCQQDSPLGDAVFIWLEAAGILLGPELREVQKALNIWLYPPCMQWLN